MKQHTLNTLPIFVLLFLLLPSIACAEMHMFSTPFETSGGHRGEIEPCDVNADGLMDVFAWWTGQDNEMVLVHARKQYENGEFGDTQVIVWPLDWNGDAEDLSAVDWDQDGDSDFVLAGDFAYSSEITVFLNQGNDSFHVGPSLPEPGVQDIETGDIDGDGDIDIAVDLGHWWENQDGQFVEHEFDQPYGLPVRIYLLDIDADDDLDLVQCTYDWLVVLENDGAGGFTTSYSTDERGAYEMKAADIDSDGDRDLVLGRSNQAWILAKEPNGTWSETVIYDGDFDIYGKYGMLVVDFDADFDLDIVASGTWLKNTAEGFVRHDCYNLYLPALPYHADDNLLIDFVSRTNLVQIHRVAARRSDHLLTDDRFTWIATGDFNQDGLDDLLLSDLDYLFTLFINTADGLTDPVTFGGFTDDYYIEDKWIIDAEGDGDLDIITFEQDGGWTPDPDTMFAYTNDGQGSFEKTLFFAPDTFLGGIGVGDMDLDGDADFAALYGHYDSREHVLYYQNPDGFTSIPLPSIHDNGTYLAVDHEGDGDMDLINYDYYYWSGNIHVDWLIQDEGEFEIHPGLGYPDGKEYSLICMDFDSDGYADVVSDRYMNWNEQDFSFDVVTLDLPQENINDLQVVACDINQDNLPELLYNYNDRLYLMMNRGNQSFEMIPFTIGYSFSNFVVMDVGGDGDLDLIGQDGNDGLILLENLFANPPSISLSLLPPENPVIIPAGGGSFSYGLTLTNELRNRMHPNVVFSVLRGNNNIGLQHYAPTLFPFEPIQIESLHQDVAASVPADTYSYRVRVWDPDEWNYPLAEDSFTVIKQGTTGTDAPLRAHDWSLSGWPGLESGTPSAADFVAEKTEASLPNEFLIAQVYPNPFNGITSLHINLPQRAHLKAQVFDILGREVMTLADQPFSAGRHTLTVDASTLASGMYFLRVNQPGGATRLQKLVLLK